MQRYIILSNEVAVSIVWFAAAIEPNVCKTEKDTMPKDQVLCSQICFELFKSADFLRRADKLGI